MSKSITYEEEYCGLDINTNKDKKQGCYVEMLNKQKDLYESYLKKHNKVLAVRYDLRFPASYKQGGSNEEIKKHVQRMRKTFARKKSDPKYLWAREQSSKEHQHYHVVFFVDGNKHQHPSAVHKEAEKQWANSLGVSKEEVKGLVDYCISKRGEGEGRAHYTLRRNKADFDEEKQKCFKRISYLAKVSTKGKANKYCNEYGYSQGKKNK